MNNKNLAFAIALMMALSGFTVLASASDDVAAADLVESDVGDAWGLGGTITLDTIIDYANEENPMDQKLDKQKLMELLSSLISEQTDSDAKVNNLDLSIDLWQMTELAEHTSSGYTLDLDLAAKLTVGISLTITGYLPGDYDDLPDGPVMSLEEEEDEEDSEDDQIDTLDIKSSKLTGDLVMHAKVFLDNNKDVTGMTLKLNTELTDILESNLNVDEDGGITYPDTFNTQKIVLGADLMVNTDFIGKSLQVLPDEGQTSWSQNVTVNTNVIGSYYLNTPYPDGNFSDNVNESDTDDTNIAFVAQWKTVDGVSVVSVQQVGEDMSIVYTYPFEYDPMYIDAPDAMKLSENGKLDDAAKKKVSDKIKEIDDEREGASKDTVFTVTFLDDDDNVIDSLTKTVKYGETIALPDYPAGSPHEADEVFMGWEFDDILWNESYPVKSNMTLEAEFADVTDQMPGKDDFVNNPSIKWDSDVDDIVDKIVDNDIFGAGNTLYITVKDNSGNVLYEWKIADSSMNGVSKDTVIMPQIDEKDVPDEVYLKDVAGDKKTIYLDFKASGVMPNHTVVSYYVGDVFNDGDTVQIYYDNDDVKSAEHSGTAVVVDGFVDIPLKHCSSYMLVSDGNASANGGDNTLMLVAIGFAALVVIIAAVYVFARNKKNKSE